MKRIIVGLTVVTIAGLISFWLSGGISGEVFSVSPGGKPAFSPGAQVVIFRSSRTSNVATFLASPAFESIRQEYFNKVWTNLAKYPSGIVERFNWTAAFMFSTQVYAKSFMFFGQPVKNLRTDEHGRFSVRLGPGAYAILVDGQAGSQQSIWLESVQVHWRTEVTLSDPICKYDVTSP